jgi:SAM-dependent methyltransferase
MERESALRESFVKERFDHPPKELELTDLTKFAHGDPGRVLSCSNCGSLLREEEETPSYERDTYDPNLMSYLYPRYLRSFERKTRYRSLLGHRAEILELGSHLGAFLEVAENWGWRPTGIDIGNATANFARDRGLSVKRAPIEDYWPRQKVEAVFIWNCFEQLENPTHVLRHCHRVLQPDGVVVIRVPNANFYRLQKKWLRTRPSSEALRSLAYNNLLGFPYLHGYSPSLLYRLLIANGFRPIGAQGSTLLTPPYPELSAKIQREWNAVQRKAAQSRPADAPWIEIVCQRAIGRPW